MRISDWSSDVCSSDLYIRPPSRGTWQRTGSRGRPERPRSMAKRRWAMLTEGIVRVLVFDGDDDYRRTLSAHLMSAGMEVMAYGHGGTTLDEALHSGPCDAALFNVHMPVEIGRENV